MPSNLFDLTGEVAAIIGGTGALGGAMAQALGEAGAKVAIIGRSAERGQERVLAIQAAGGTAIFQSADAMSAESLTAARDSIASQLGAVTVLVNAAGGNNPTPRSPQGAISVSCPAPPGMKSST